MRAETLFRKRQARLPKVHRAESGGQFSKLCDSCVRSSEEIRDYVLSLHSSGRGSARMHLRVGIKGTLQEDKNGVT